MRYFEVAINGNFHDMAKNTIVAKNEKDAVKIATRDAKWNRNSFIIIIEVDENGDNIDGFVSGKIFIK